MKLSKLLVAGSLALIVASMASAQQFIKITGSTAFRTATNIAIARTLTPPAGFSKVQAAYKGSNLSGASQAIFHGKDTLGADTYIQTGWAGSVGGIEVVATNVPAALTIGGSTAIVWMDAANLPISGTTADVTTVAGVSISGGLSIAGTPTFGAASTADIAMSDSYVTSTKFVGAGYTALSDTSVGVIPFSFIRGKSNIGGAETALTNISPLAFQNLANAGVVPLSMFTGNSAHSIYDVVLVGRDNDSGTRLVTFAETAFGIGGACTQYNIGTAASPQAPVAFPSVGAGYSSGGTMVGAMGVAAVGLSPNGKPYVTVAYAGVNDAKTLATAGGAILSYNGVYTQSPTAPYATNNTLIQEGQATFWSAQHLVYRTAFGTYGATVWNASKKTFADAVANNIIGGDATASGLLLSTMSVDRAAEGFPVYYNL